MPHRPARKRVMVIDRRSFATAISRLVAELGGRSTRAAAKTVNSAMGRRAKAGRYLSREFFRRWQNADTPHHSLSENTYNALLAYLDAVAGRAERQPPSKWTPTQKAALAIRTAVKRAVSSSEADDRWDEYFEWLIRRSASFGPRGSRYFKILVSKAETKVDTLFDSVLSRFRAEMNAWGHEDPRIELAVWRILDPLLDHAFTAGVEVDLLGAADRTAKGSKAMRVCRRIVMDGVYRERLLLDRAQAHEAAQQARGPVGLVVRLPGTHISLIAPRARRHSETIRQEALRAALLRAAFRSRSNAT